MPKKKGGGGAAKGPPAATTIELPRDQSGWVKINLKLVNWTFDNETVTVRASTPLYSLVRRITDKHGHVEELALYKGQVNPGNQLEDMEAPLAALGFDGFESPAVAKSVNVYYDFKPIVESNPLLLVTPRTHYS